MGKLYRVRKSRRRNAQKQEIAYLRRAQYTARLSGQTTNDVVRVEKKGNHRKVRNGHNSFRNAITNFYLAREKLCGENSFSIQSDGMMVMDYTRSEKRTDWFIAGVKEILLDKNRCSSMMRHTSIFPL